MKANEANLLRFLDSTKQFILPIFQRRYSWEKRHCEQLWEDILRVGENEDIPSHFLGSIVSIGDGSPTIPKFLVIDGQQRLTTLSLLLSALSRAIEKKNIDIRIDRSRLEGYYIFNDREEGELRYKQLLTPHDKDTLIQLLETGEASDNTSLLVANYQFFEDKLKRVDLETVYNGIQKLMIVDIALDSRSDNPQLIFESLNSTGLSLSQADLIRNYVLMGQEPNIQNKLYETYWYPMEQSFGTEYAKRFDLFIRDYLTLKTRQIPNKGQVYESFKRYVADKKQPETLEAIIKEIVHYSKHYVRIALLEEADRELHGCLEDIHALSVEVVFPFLLGLYEDYMQSRIEKTEVIGTLRLIESYVFRRAICGIPTHALNKVFAALTGQIDKDNYLQSLKTVFSRMTGVQRFPSDNEFKREFLIKDVYNLRTRNYLRNYLLPKLENHGRKEPIRVEDYTIEHVMPQTLSEEWQSELGESWRETHEKYLHTIGNLTLTGYNSELSNNTFIDKQLIEGGFLDSPLRLNENLRKAEQWDETAIVNRAEMLLEKACKIWPDHGVPREIRQKQKGDWTLADHHHLIGEMLELFQQLGQRVLKLDASVREQITKYYIGYSMNTTFVTIYPQATRLRLLLNLPFSDTNDPQGVCRDLAHMDHHQLGDIEVGLYSTDELDDIMFLIHQAFEKQKGARQEQGKQKGVRQEQRGDWTLADHHHLTGEIMKLFQQLQERILNLDTSVSEGITKLYIGYRMTTAFVVIFPQAQRLRLLLNLPFSDLNDPQGMCRDLSHTGHHELGDIEVVLSYAAELDYIMFLIQQAFQRQIASR